LPSSSAQSHVADRQVTTPQQDDAMTSTAADEEACAAAVGAVASTLDESFNLAASAASSAVPAAVTEMNYQHECSSGDVDLSFTDADTDLFPDFFLDSLQFDDL